jgi:hypothetical protein
VCVCREELAAKAEAQLLRGNEKAAAGGKRAGGEKKG